MKLSKNQISPKYLLLTLALLSISSCISSEEKHEEDDKITFSDYYFEKKDNEEFVTLSMSGWLAKTLITSEDEAADELLSSLDDIRILIYDGDESSISHQTNELEKCLQSGDYHDIMMVKDGDTQIDFKIREGENGIDELLIYQNDGHSFVALSLEGHLDFKDISDPNTLIKVNQIQDLKELQNQ